MAWEAAAVLHRMDTFTITWARDETSVSKYTSFCFATGTELSHAESEIPFQLLFPIAVKYSVILKFQSVVPSSKEIL